MVKKPKKLPKKTCWCEKEKKCLEKDNCCDCRVTSSINGEVLFVKSTNSYCPYKMQYADEWICTCPLEKSFIFLKEFKTEI